MAYEVDKAGINEDGSYFVTKRDAKDPRAEWLGHGATYAEAVANLKANIAEYGDAQFGE